MTQRLGFTLGVFGALAICMTCEPVQAYWQENEPAKLTLHFAVRAHEPQLNDLDAVIESFEAKGPEAAADHVRWLPLYDVEHWLPEANDVEHDLIVKDLPRYFELSRRMIARPHEDRMYLLVHASPPKLPDDVKPRKSLTVGEVTFGVDAQGRRALDITLDEKSGAWVAAVSQPNVGLPLAIIVDGEVYAAPILRSQIGRRLQVSGLPRDDVRELRNRLIGLELAPKSD